MLLTKKEIYDWMKQILASSGFEKDDAKQQISVSRSLTEAELDKAAWNVANLLGHSKYPKPEPGVLPSQFKVNSRYIDLDEKTMTVNKLGQITTTGDTESIAAHLVENEAFVKKVADAVVANVKADEDFAVSLLKNQLFVSAITALVDARIAPLLHE